MHSLATHLIHLILCNLSDRGKRHDSIVDDADAYPIYFIMIRGPAANLHRLFGYNYDVVCLCLGAQMSEINELFIEKRSSWLFLPLSLNFLLSLRFIMFNVTFTYTQ